MCKQPYRRTLKLAKGPPCSAGPFILIRYQPACKPGSVRHHRLSPAIRDGHSSGTTLARCLEQPTRTAGLTSPCGVIVFTNLRGAVPIRFCSRWGLPCRFRCRRRGALLPHLFTLTRVRRSERFVFCGTFPGVAPAGRYPAPHVDGARTFLSRGLSAIAGAAVRPTDAMRHERFRCWRQAVGGKRTGPALSGNRGWLMICLPPRLSDHRERGILVYGVPSAHFWRGSRGETRHVKKPL